MYKDHYLVWPNTVPFNAMLLAGRLPFKTRKKEPLHGYRGIVLFYNSTRKANKPHILGEGLDAKSMAHSVIVGEGRLYDVRILTTNEKADFAQKCYGIYGAFPLGYFFDHLIQYRQPIPAIWPRGVIQGAWVQANDYQSWRIRAINGMSDPFEAPLPLLSRVIDEI